MKGIPAKSIVLLAFTSFAATISAQNDVRIDGSSQEAFDASLERMAKTLTADDRRVFDQTVRLIAVLAPATEGTRKRLDGASATTLLRLGRKLIGEFDANHDGSVDDGEVARASGQLEATRRHANEAAAIATLRSISSAQAQMQAMSVLDVDGDGVGEHGYFGEMTGATPLRTKVGKGKQRIDPPVLSSRFAVDQRRVERSGYLFQLWLPGDQGVAVPEADRGGVDTGNPPNVDLAETGFTCYAWPVENGKTGNRVFVVDQFGEIFFSDNSVQQYSGPDKAPTPYAALQLGTRTLVGNLATATKRNDGGQWQAEAAAAPQRGR